MSKNFHPKKKKGRERRTLFLLLIEKRKFYSPPIQEPKTLHWKIESPIEMQYVKQIRLYKRLMSTLHIIFEWLRRNLNPSTPILVYYNLQTWFLAWLFSTLVLERKLCLFHVLCELDSALCDFFYNLKFQFLIELCLNSDLRYEFNSAKITWIW